MLWQPVFWRTNCESEITWEKSEATRTTEGEGGGMFNSDSDKPRKEGKDHMSPSIQGNGFQFAFSVQSGRILCMRMLGPLVLVLRRAQSFTQGTQGPSLTLWGAWREQTSPGLWLSWIEWLGRVGLKTTWYMDRSCRREVLAQGKGAGSWKTRGVDALCASPAMVGGAGVCWGWVSKQWFRKPTQTFHSPCGCENGQQQVKHSSFFQEPCWRKQLMDSSQGEHSPCWAEPFCLPGHCSPSPGGWFMSATTTHQELYCKLCCFQEVL